MEVPEFANIFCLANGVRVLYPLIWLQSQDDDRQR